MLDKALERVAQIIRGYPKDNHGDLCIAVFRELQMDVRPASMLGLWDRPAPPSKRQLALPATNQGGDKVLLDDQLVDFAGVAAGMILDYPKEHQCEVWRTFQQELRARLGWERGP
jgi:hypothetical protein